MSLTLSAEANSAAAPLILAEAETCPQSFTRIIADLALSAMLREVNLSPKPGLVDRYNTGAHKDMTLADFHRSARAIHAELPNFIRCGAETAALPPEAILELLRPIGLRCEQAMFRATGGVNTHKGSIFSLGLLCAAAGRLFALRQPITPSALCRTAAEFCRGMVERELARDNLGQTAGQRLYRELGLTGARGEADAGWPLVLNYALPHYQSCLASGQNEHMALLNALLVLIARNRDTNLAARGGMSGLLWMQSQAKALLAKGGIKSPADYIALHRLNQQCAIRNLSPGGSADLLIITWFLANLPQTEIGRI